MEIEILDIPDKAKQLLKDKGFKKLYPPQVQCIKAGLLQNNNMLITIPTASGKTLMGILGIIKHFSENKGTVVYLTPLKALTAEKYNELKMLEDIDLNIKVGIQTSDRQEGIDNANIRVMTNETLVIALLRQQAWTKNIGLVISDEIHIVNDNTRGPNLEMVLTILLNKIPAPRIIALSASVGNADTVANWLKAKSVSSDWRPIKLCEGVLYPNKIRFNNSTDIPLDKKVNNQVTLALDVMHLGQSLIFAGTRKMCVSTAKDAYDSIKLCPQKVARLDKMSKELLDVEEVTNLTSILAKLIKNGVAFHHAGLNEKCRRMVEDGFRNRDIMLIVSTPTLATGINLPARRVIISNYIKYNPESYISVLEYKQMCGRAGRPGYDDIGESIIIPDAQHDSDEVFENYVNGTIENITSKLTCDLDFFVLACIAIGKKEVLPNKLAKVQGANATQILKFFDKTLARLQDDSTLEEQIMTSVEYLVEKKIIIEKQHAYKPTEFGYLIHQYMMEPRSAVYIRDWLMVIPNDHFMQRMLTRLLLIDEQIPSSIFSEDWDDAQYHPQQHNIEAMYNSILDWIQERPLLKIESKHNVYEGDLYRNIEILGKQAVWVAAIAKFTKNRHFSAVQKIRKRIKYGVKEELLELVKIRQIGRVRARKLYKHKIDTIQKLINTKPSTIARILNLKKMNLANNIIQNAKRIEL